ncbi:MAG: uracil-DNA glycosylase [Saccharospirillaceae bacterium]|nr:uracil-DNA glycosylase [Pseudomonadales bacterium]NRB80041.1 uracil-DNA glycosylase [Saccharospirillaceae bacterium]
MTDALLQLIPKDWVEVIGEPKIIGILKPIDQFLKKQKNKQIFPETVDIFNAFKLTSFENTKVVILGQDPYHGLGQAHGLAFSVQDDCKIPPSLKNIFKELESDVGVQIPMTGNLTHWAKQGVLLLNTVLTVEATKANSHKGIGWEDFTDEVIKNISAKKKNVVFVLWGASAGKKVKIINTDGHIIIQSVHPSPLSSYRGFFGSRPFSKINTNLKEGVLKINW